MSRASLLMAVVTVITAMNVVGDEPTNRVAALIRSLQDNSQAQREAAVSGLEQAGLKAIEPLTQTALGNDVEAGILAVSVLENLDLADDVAVQSANGSPGSRRAHCSRISACFKMSL